MGQAMARTGTAGRSATPGWGGRRASWLGDAALIVIFLFLLFPIYWALTMSLKTQPDTVTWPPKFLFSPTLDNYRVEIGRAHV